MSSFGKRIGMRWAVAMAVVVALVVAGSLVPVLAGRTAVQEADAAQGVTKQLNDALGVLQAAGPVDYFLKIDGIDGEADAVGHENWIEIESWSWGATNTSGGATGKATGKATISSFNITKMVDKASPKLMLAVATGEHSKDARLEAVRAGELEAATFLTIKLTDLLVSSYQVGGSSGAVPTESLSLNVTKIEFEYRPQDPDGSLGSPVKACYDLKQNKKC